MDYVTRQFINLTKNFRKDLRQALSTLTGALQKQTEAIRNSYQASNNKQSPSPEVTVLNNLPSSIEVHQKEKDAQDERNYRRFMFLVTTLTLGAIAVYAALVYWQYRQMITATDAAVRSADAATKALKDSDDRFKLDHRPYMIVRDPILSSIDAVFIGGNGVTTGTIENVGTGVAFNEYGFPAVDIVDFDISTKLPVSDIELGRKIDSVFKKDVTDKMKEADRGAVSPPLRDIAPKTTATLGAPLIGKTVTQLQFLGFVRGTSFIVFMGMLRYSAFNERHETEFCWFATHPQPDRGTTPGKMNWVLCKGHNTIR